MIDGPSVVIVDDEVTLAMVMKALVLQQWPAARVAVFTEPDDISPRLSEVPAGSVVLMDRRLGGVDSYGLITSLIAARSDLRVALLTASLGPEEAARARRAGAFAAFEKPVSLAEWRVLLAQLIAGPHGARPKPGPAVA